MNKPTVYDAIEEYYKLKNKYEIEQNNNKKKILNNNKLSIKEKRREYLKLKPKCIHCKRVGGTIFAVKYSLSENKFEHRELKATCGIIADPCNLNITIHLGLCHLLPNLLKELSTTIIDTKDIIIDNKNKLLFGLITTDEAIEEFENDKEFINYSTSMYEEYLNKLIFISENPVKKTELKENIEKSYIIIENIKECVKKYNETKNNDYIRDSVELLNSSLTPLLIDIRKLKYKEYYIDYNDKSNVFYLVQKKSSIESLEYVGNKSIVIEYNIIPYKSNKLDKKSDNKDKTTATLIKPIKKRIFIESDTENEDEEEDEDE